MDRVVEADPLLTPKADTVDISPRIRGITKPLSEVVAHILNNNDRAKHELQNARERKGVSKRGEFLGELGKMQDEFDGFFVSCEVLKSKFCIVFSAPEMKKYSLCFSEYPLITDVTYKAMEDGYYLCSTVIFSPELQKNLVIFQAVINGLSSQYFETYFVRLLEHFQINPQQFMGIVMDFSAAQIKGFKAAFKKSFGSEDSIKFFERMLYALHAIHSKNRVNAFNCA